MHIIKWNIYFKWKQLECFEGIPASNLGTYKGKTRPAPGQVPRLNHGEGPHCSQWRRLSPTCGPGVSEAGRLKAGLPAGSILNVPPKLPNIRAYEPLKWVPGPFQRIKWVCLCPRSLTTLSVLLLQPQVWMEGECCRWAASLLQAGRGSEDSFPQKEERQDWWVSQTSMLAKAGLLQPKSLNSGKSNSPV